MNDTYTDTHNLIFDLIINNPEKAAYVQKGCRSIERERGKENGNVRGTRLSL
jgi:hypothetical protein